MRKFILPMVFFALGGIASGLWLGRAPVPAPVNVPSPSATEPAAESPARTDELQSRLDEMLAELNEKNARLAEVHEKLLKFLLVELGLKLRRDEIAALEKREAEAVKAERAAAAKAATPDAPESRERAAASGGESVEPAARAEREFPAEHYAVEAGPRFGTESLFTDKKATAPEDLGAFRNLRGRYVGLVNFQDGTQGALEVVFRPGRGEGGARALAIGVVLRGPGGQRIIDRREPSTDVKLLTFGPDTVESVGEVQTAYVMAGDHRLAIAWPSASRGGASTLEGYYHYQGLPSKRMKGKEAGVLRLRRSGEGSSRR